MTYHELDLERFPRRSHLEYFSSLAYPYVGITQEVEVTALLDWCKAGRHSFYMTFLHAVALAANDVRELRQRLRQGKVIEYDNCPTSHIELLPNETYCYCTLHHDMPLPVYLPYAQARRKACLKQPTLEEDEDVESMLFISTLPWLHYTSLIQPAGGGDDSNPRITWGRYEQNSRGRWMLPVTVMAHHALVDGLHIARFYERLTRHMNTMLSDTGESFTIPR